MKIQEAQERTPELLENLLNIWEDSVRATHLFLLDEEVEKIREYVPDAIRGVGHLIWYGIRNYGIQEVTVNEQNPQAVAFYEHIGFETYKRADHDEEGNPYPLLYMKLQ